MPDSEWKEPQEAKAYGAGRRSPILIDFHTVPLLCEGEMAKGARVSRAGIVHFAHEDVVKR